MKPTSIHAALGHLIGKNRAPFLWGASGIGKSDVVAQFAKDSKLELRDVRLGLLDPTDIKGFPVVNAARSQMSWLPADFLPTKGKGILFLDEMNTAPQAVQAAAYQLVLNRQVGDYKVPPGWSIIAAGNRVGDRSVVHAMPSALANRFIHIDFEIDNDDWNTWAGKNGIHTDLRAFMRFRPALLHSFDPTSNPRSFPSPRSWAFVNDIYKSNLNSAEEFELVKGTVGEGAAAEFTGFTRLIKDLPTIDSVLLNPDTAAVPASPAGKYAILTALDSKTTVNNFARAMQYVSRIEPEFQVMYMRDTTRRDKKLENTKTYLDWGVKNQALLT